MGRHQERHELNRQAKLDKIEEQVRDGSLVIRQASEAEREGWAKPATGPRRSFIAGPGLSCAGARLPQPTADPNPEADDA